jgi:hypothetical protein
MMQCIKWCFFAVIVLCAGWVFAQDHTDKVKGPFKNGPEVTATCVGCHEKQTKDFMKTVHWTWSKKQEVPGKGTQDLGKKNAINNF